MGRPESRLDLNQPLGKFAQDLRVLRSNAQITYRELARRTTYSATALSSATRGERLPSLSLTIAFVEGCGGNPDAWAQRWERVSQEVKKKTSTEPSAGARTYAPPPWVSSAANSDQGNHVVMRFDLGQLSQVVTVSEFVRQMHLLRVVAKNPSLRELSRRVSDLRRPDLRLPVSSISDALRGDQLPPWKTVEAFVYACGATREIREWEAVWVRLAAIQGGFIAAPPPMEEASGTEYPAWGRPPPPGYVSPIPETSTRPNSDPDPGPELPWSEPRQLDDTTEIRPIPPALTSPWGDVQDQQPPPSRRRFLSRKRRS